MFILSSYLINLILSANDKTTHSVGCCTGHDCLKAPETLHRVQCWQLNLDTSGKAITQNIVTPLRKLI